MNQTNSSLRKQSPAILILMACLSIACGKEEAPLPEGASLPALRAENSQLEAKYLALNQKMGEAAKERDKVDSEVVKLKGSLNIGLTESLEIESKRLSKKFEDLKTQTIAARIELATSDRKLMSALGKNPKENTQSERLKLILRNLH